MTYQVKKSRRKSEDVILIDLEGASGTVTVVTSVNFGVSSYTTRDLTVVDGVITTIGDEQTVS